LAWRLGQSTIGLAGSIMTAISNLKVYATHPHQCSYLEDQQATTLFVDPETNIDPETYNQLATMGFRRSGPHVYRPHCDSCKACIAARVPVELFKPSRRQRKIINRNQDLQIKEIIDINTLECYTLYERYISERHADGDMHPATLEQYLSFLTDDIGITKYYGFMLDEQLIAVAVTDVMESGLSAIYTFFDPDFDRRSLGVYGVLWQIEHSKQLGLPYVYLGYWIKDCRKMSYKTDYRPLQLLMNNRWLTLT
jgi:arginine-tRNA-protein transferase